MKIGELWEPKATKQLIFGTKKNTGGLLLKGRKPIKLPYGQRWIGRTVIGPVAHRDILYKGVYSMTVMITNIYADEWKSLPWKKFQQNLFRLQHRIYKAAKENDYVTVKRLQSLLLGSKSSKFLAVRQVTQLNFDRKTVGVDEVNSLNPKERLQLVTELDSIRTWKHRKLRKVFIGNQKPIRIPTIRDRAMQCLVKFALEPVYQSYASDGSFGFGPAHSTGDVQNRLFQNLKSNFNGFKKTILKLDIKGCFDNISHEKMMNLSTLPGSAKRFLRSALKAGVLKERDKTLVGSVISPVLSNIALNGIEDLNNTKIRGQKYQRGLRYADNMVFILQPGESGITLLEKVKNFLSSRGLEAEAAKPRIVSLLEGFDFLGWHFRVKANNHKFVCYPSSKNRKQLITKIKTTLKDSRYKIEDRLKMVKTVYRGWWNYHQFCDMGQVNLWFIRDWVYKYLRKSTKMPIKKIKNHLELIFRGVREDRSIYDGKPLNYLQVL